jgi:hypothetical protein
MTRLAGIGLIQITRRASGLLVAGYDARGLFAPWDDARARLNDDAPDASRGKPGPCSCRHRGRDAVSGIGARAGIATVLPAELTWIKEGGAAPGLG